MERIKSIEQLEELKKQIDLAKDPNKTCIAVCCGTGCSASGARQVIESFKEEMKKQNLGAKVLGRSTGCQGFCERGPIVLIFPKKVFYQKVTPKDVPEIISETVVNGKIIERLLYKDVSTGDTIIYMDDIPFYKKQSRELFANTALINPLNIYDYISVDGYLALSKALKMKPEEIIEEIKKSGLRGRGGAGFPTGRKWGSCRNAHGEPKYVICNADEGDPGAFMDRSLLEGNPHSVLEGMIIGAYAIGSNYGYIYVRNEYPLAIKHFSTALKQAEELGLLGKNILGSGFDFTVKISRGGGAFVCGESSALRASIEGRVGEPSVKYVHATEKGLYEKPTVLNNVKTWASVTLIINKGANWFNSIGTPKSKGTMIFSLVGKVNNTGLVEVPMGIKLRELIYDIGGGIIGGKKFKAVQSGGPSGGCIPESLLNLPIDYEALTSAGSMMGSGGMIVMDETTCMVNVAKYFLSFTQEESCGKCVPCREGIKHMLNILKRITEGNGEEGDIEFLEKTGEMIKKTSLCQLGGSAPNPVLSTIKYFRDEYLVHIKDKKCPAKVCTALINYFIIENKCTGCVACVKACPQGAITGERKKPHIIDQSKCIKCGICESTCNFDAIEVR